MPNNTIIKNGNPTSLNISRSKISLDHTWSGTFNAGDLVPFLAYSDILPATTWKMNTNFVVRSVTPIAPVMDDLFMDVFYFWVPAKLVLSRETMSAVSTTDSSYHSFEAMIGAQDNLLNMPIPGNYQLPYCITANTPIVGGLLDCMGLSTLVAQTKINPLPVLSYYQVWNDYFRDPNTMNPVVMSLNSGWVWLSGGPTGYFGSFGSDADTYKLIKACRLGKSYFTSALPWPQRNLVNTPIFKDLPVNTGLIHDINALNGTAIVDSSGAYGTSGNLMNDNGSLASDGSGAGSGNVSAWFGNLWAKSGDATVNAVRMAFATQRWYEAIARSGNRLPEFTAALFGVVPHDAASGVAEYLGGKHVRLNLTQVANTSGTTYSTATQQSIGSTGAYSLTSDSDYYFTKSFDTWGTVIGVCTVRPHESYHQGLHRMWTRFKREDYYFPQYAHIGEQPILNKEIYAASATPDEVFGYQEAWSDYRYIPDFVTGLLRPGQSLGYWTYCNNFASQPTLAGFLYGDSLKDNVDQTLQVKSSTAGFQFQAQFGMNIEAVLPMPVHSIPGLIDHH